MVEARDASGLRQAAPFVLTIGGVERRGFLRCDGAAGTCRETLPPEPGALALVEVTVEDYAGNAAKRQRVTSGEGKAMRRCRLGTPRCSRTGLAPAASAQPAPLMVVYGPEAPTREGDPDHVERLFISVPADLADRLYLRVFDPEPAGAHDTRYGRGAARRPRRSSGSPAARARARGAPLPAAGRGRRRPGAPPRPRPPPASPAAACSPSGASTRRAPPTTPG